MITLTRLFNPLTGIELQEILAAQFKAELSKTELLQAHLTFPKVNYTITLELLTYPMDKPEIIAFSREIGETQETAPDKLREDNEIPTLRTERSPETGQMIDVRQPVKTVATVGKGTEPRTAEAIPKPSHKAKAKRIVEVQAEPVGDQLLDDDGNPIETMASVTV